MAMTIAAEAVPIGSSVRQGTSETSEILQPQIWTQDREREH